MGTMSAKGFFQRSSCWRAFRQVETPVEAIKKEADILQSMAGELKLPPKKQSL